MCEIFSDNQTTLLKLVREDKELSGSLDRIIIVPRDFSLRFAFLPNYAAQFIQLVSSMQIPFSLASMQNGMLHTRN